MNKVFALAIAAAVAGAAGSAFAIEPIPGSITFNGNEAHLDKSPVGSSFQNQFVSGGNTYRETYIVQPDRSVKLVGRVELDD